MTESGEIKRTDKTIVKEAMRKINLRNKIITNAITKGYKGNIGDVIDNLIIAGVIKL